jgi:hypothetical protein
VKGIDPRWILAAVVVVVWSALVLIDAFSLSYTVDAGLHVGAGGLLGVLLGSGLLGNNGKGTEGP